MSWWEKILAKAIPQPITTTSSRRETGGLGYDDESEFEARQPFSDGSEEFFEKFMPRDDHRWRPNKHVIIGLGITAGVLAGVGIAVWLKKSKRRKSWRELLVEK